VNAHRMRLPDILNKVRLKLLIPFFFLAFYTSILLYILFFLLAYVYGLLPCSQVWIEWKKEVKDALVVYTRGRHSQEWVPRIRDVVGTRAVFLNHDERDCWDRWSLPAQLFHIFGPHATQERFTGDNLPAVIVFKKMKAPKKFIFGKRSKDSDEKLERLRAELALN
jgi:hypothetical protein